MQERWARLHLTTRALANVPVPSSFTMQLRKHLEGSRLLRVEQPGLERVARLVVAGRDELGDPFERVLVAELIGKYANLFLVDGADGVVMGCLRPVTEEMCRVRQLGPGLPYDPPPAEKPDFTTVGEDVVLAALGRGGKLADALSGQVSGLSRVAAAQLVVAAGLPADARTDDVEGLEALLDVVRRAQVSLAARAFHVRLEAGPTWDYQCWALDGARDGGASAFFDAYYGGREERFGLDERRRKIAGDVGTAVRKQAERVAGWREQLAKSEKADRERELGDLLTAHMYMLAPGMAEVEVTDFYAEEQPTIVLKLDARLTPSENAQRHFRRYQKLRNARTALDQLLGEGEAELAYLAQVETAVAIATSARDLAEVAEELAGYQGKPPVPLRRGEKPEAPAPLKFTSSDGLPIWVGKNNKQNDHLTFKLARAGDWWLHTQNIPGSHVLVQAEGEVPERTLHEAAMLAAFFSQARSSSRVPVVYTRRKHVRKPRGARPGMVIYDHERTLFVDPEGALQLTATPAAGSPPGR